MAGLLLLGILGGIAAAAIVLASGGSWIAALVAYAVAGCFTLLGSALGVARLRI
ncbi:MAG TPA: hypothetical protein GXX24_10535 [Paracoccus solventivorans]|uniref:Uncharacterized protein n=1 Tax=Paracoccus solventivorans TaxID=53463 RepID=A0A832PNA2_9RHOB|nr:hypothetical protein [Paracoccus solventivorans]HHW34558.1 hypothetical protein [Paracoccus solventivorans]